jgi:hypothetical protein
MHSFQGKQEANGQLCTTTNRPNEPKNDYKVLYVFCKRFAYQAECCNFCKRFAYN